MRPGHPIVLLAVLSSSTTALADDAADKKEADAELAQSAARMQEACGAKIAVQYEWGSEASVPGRPAAQGPVYCKSVVDGLTSGCADAAAKGVIAAQIKTVTCRVAAGASKSQELDAYGGPILKLTGTTLTATYDWNSSNIDSETLKWTAKKMLTPGPNGPVTVEAMKERAEGEQRLGEAVAAFQEKCGAKIPVSYDFTSEKGNAARPAWQGFLYCKGVLEGIATACESDGAKGAVGKKLKSVACRFEAGASKHKELDPYGGAWHVLKNGRLDASYEWTSSNLEDGGRRWAAKLK